MFTACSYQYAYLSFVSYELLSLQKDHQLTDTLHFNCYQNYQFWAKADDDGYFTITNVLAGDYNVYAWVPGFIGDYKYDVVMNITEGIRKKLFCFFFLNY